MIAPTAAAHPSPRLVARLAPWLLLAGWGLAMLILFRPAIHGIDTVGYYSWLRSAAIQGSLDVSDEFEALGYGGERGLAPSGLQLNEYPVGSAVMWAPFFGLGHLAALATGLPADGYSAPYRIAVALGSSLYALAGLWLLLRLLRQMTSPSSALWACLTAFFASPLLFYATAHPFMSHANDFALHALLLILWMRPSEATPGRRLLFGLVAGLAASVRLQNAVLLFWPVGEELLGLARRSASPRSAALRLIATGAGALIGLAPQLLAWRVVYGQWLVLNPYGLSDMGEFTWTSPHFWDVLFSSKGLLAWTPAYAPGLVGLGYLLWADRSPLRAPCPPRRMALFLLGSLFLLVYVIGSWQVWTGAAAFGQRFLTSCAPTLAVSLATLYERWRERQRGFVALLVSGLLAGWNLVLLARYGLGDIPRHGLPGWQALTWGQLRFVVSLPERAWSVLQHMRR